MHTPLHARQRGPLNWALLLLATLLLNGGALRAQTADTYNFAASTGTYTQLTGGTVVAFSSADDALSSTIPLPFAFVFDGNSYTSCKASTNGWLSFNPAASGSSLGNDLAAGVASERPRVAPFWDDLNGGSAGVASYATTGTAPNRVFTFEWRNWDRFSGSGPSLSMQVQLVEGTNAVRFVYRREANSLTGASASIGLSGAGTAFLSLSDSGASPSTSSSNETDNIATPPATGQIYTFTPPIITACPTPRNLNSAVLTNSAFVTFTVTNTTNPGPFTIIYGPAGFNPLAPASSTNQYQTVTTTTNSYILTGLTALTTYQYYVVQNCGGSTGNSSMSSVGTFTTNPNPATNDNCAQAVALPVGATCTAPTNGTVFGATQSIAPTTGCTSATAQDVWYSFVANGTTQTIAFAPLFDGVMDVRSGNCTTSTSIFCTSAAARASVSSNIGGLTNGQTYYVRVYASGSTAPVVASSTFTLCVTTGPVSPANDECANAVPLSVGTTCSTPVIGTVLAAAQSLPPTPNCTATNAFDVWYSFVATGTTQTITFAPQFAGILNVRSGACATSTSIFCAATGAGLTTNNNLTGLTNGQTYYVRVYPSTATAPAPSASTFILCASGRPTASRAQADTEALLVFPNPSSTGQLTLRLASGASAGHATLLNALGQVVVRQQLSNAAEQTLSTKALAAGLYTLRVTMGDQVLTRKVVLE